MRWTLRIIFFVVCIRSSKMSFCSELAIKHQIEFDKLGSCNSLLTLTGHVNLPVNFLGSQRLLILRVSNNLLLEYLKYSPILKKTFFSTQGLTVDYAAVPFMSECVC